MPQQELRIPTPGRALLEITDPCRSWVHEQGHAQAMLNVFCRHTSASLILCENADPDVLVDMERYLGDLVRDGDPRFIHTAEGPDDMAAHVRSVLTASSLSIPVVGGELALGTWQGLYLWEHRHRPHTRHLLLSLVPV